MREFGNFLAPRIGFFEVETWNAVVAVLSGLVPALATAVMVIMTGLLGWLGLAALLWRTPSGVSNVTMGLGTLAWLWLLERGWRKANKVGGDKKKERDNRSKPAEQSRLAYVVSSLLIVLGVVAGWVWMPFGGQDRSLPPLKAVVGPQQFVLAWELLAPTFVWLLLALALAVLARLVLSFSPDPFGRQIRVACDRVVGRLLVLASLWALCGSAWETGRWLCGVQGHGLLGTLLGAGSSGGLFVWLQRLVGKKSKRDEVPAWLYALKPFLPQVLAYLTLFLAAALTAALLVHLEPASNHLIDLLAGLGIVLVIILWFFDPSKVGLHEFYRSRICRTYPGASNLDASTQVKASANRQTEERAGDDLDLKDLQGEDPAKREGESKIHLICCAANDLAGDHLATLSRGARSAVLSAHGIAIGNTWASMEQLSPLKLSSALTASAAAFNPNMGAISMALGRAVTFLMAALNLRLGLWVRQERRRWWPPRGWLFFREMFGQTQVREGDPSVHLSDGGHFENLALYELVRRHCRYIVASDCSADPGVAFDDFANAQRRIREDFGVEIEIDLAPLKPDADRRSQQHMVVGAIHYDGPNGVDKGILLYFKPTLTSDEPVDVLQYAERNRDFPHESTGDQFFDEAQWESYRRLGEHAARSAFRYVEKIPGSERTRQSVFSSARFEWYPTPPDLEEQLLRMGDRYAELEARLCAEAPPELVAEMFPELNVLGGEKPPEHLPSPQQMRQTLHWLLQMLKLMEEVWMSCHLDTLWNHPLNMIWVNLFQRWTQSPSFRLWWPVLAPLYNAGMREFVANLFGPTAMRVQQAGSRLHLENEKDKCPPHLFRALPEALKSQESCRIYWYTLQLTYRAEGLYKEYSIDVAVARVRANQNAAFWNRDEFWVMPGLWGSGIGTKFMKEILEALMDEGFQRCEVSLTETHRIAQETDAGSRRERTDLIEFYRGVGFFLTPDKPDGVAVLTRMLRPPLPLGIA